MISKKRKQAQFFILAAVIIVAVIITLASLTNYATVGEKPKKFYDLSDNINLEGAKLINSQLSQGKNPQEAIGNMTEIFRDYMGKDPEATADLVIITGNSSNIDIMVINETTTGGIRVSFGPAQTEVYRGSQLISTLTSAGDNTETEVSLSKELVLLISKEQIKITLPGEIKQNITLTQGQNFVFFLTKSTEFETYVESSG